MIHVLQNWQEVNTATLSLQNQNLPTHITIQKNWDQALLYQLLMQQGKQSRILDLGCGDCCTLNFLAAIGFTNLHGIDLNIKSPAAPIPYQLHQGDMTKTLFSNGFFDILTSISVIEHGVNLDAFFQEANRLLKPEGLLFVTTDYWAEKIAVDESIKPFGLGWQIFSKPEIATAIAAAQQAGFRLKQNHQIPDCSDKPVSWYDRDYTFIALTFQKG
ncbi:MAG: hypothetical protein Kow00121_64230 [Elainellaceae cyanobacterium]